MCTHTCCAMLWWFWAVSHTVYENFKDRIENGSVWLINDGMVHSEYSPISLINDNGVQGYAEAFSVKLETAAVTTTTRANEHWTYEPIEPHIFTTSTQKIYRGSNFRNLFEWLFVYGLCVIFMCYWCVQPSVSSTQNVRVIDSSLN